MQVMALGAEWGARSVVPAAGSDAAQGLAGIRSLIAKKFHDDAVPPGRSSNRPASPSRNPKP
jgi:hypothetical protein